MGLDEAGKSTILYKMRLDELVNTGPTIGYNSEEIKVKNVSIKVFDLAGQQKLRNMWKYYYSSIEGIIFVVDSSNVERLQEAKDELQHMLSNDEAQNVPVLVFANKQDMPKALKQEAIIEHLGVGDVLKSGRIHVVESSAVHDQGLQNGFEWIVDKIVANAKNSQK